MKLNKLVIACGVLFAAAASTQAFATGPANTVRLLVSGASALEISTQKAVAEMCNPALAVADRTFFRSANGNAYRCTSRVGGNGPAFSGGVAHIMDIRKRNGGGSQLGVTNVRAPGIATGFTDPASATCSAPVPVTIGGLQWNQRTGCGEVNLIPDAGVSDVEPALFGVRTGLTSSSIVAQIFGIPISDKLYRKLQTAQGINVALDPNFLPANAPSLTYPQVRSLFTGDYRDWKMVGGIGLTNAGNGSTFVKVCRRVVSSGTQASINALLLNNPCGSGPFGGQLVPANNATDDSGVNNTAATAGSLAASTAGDAYAVVMNSGAGQVDACLTDADVKGEMAVGLLGTERVSSQLGAPPTDANDDTDGKADQWHYVKLIGIYPSVANTISSNYDLFAEATFNRRISNVGYSADQLALMTRLPALMGSPAIIQSENLLGLAALWTNGFDPTLPANFPTLKKTRFGNTCQPSTEQF